MFGIPPEPFRRPGEPTGRRVCAEAAMPDEPPGQFHAHPLKRKWQKEHEHPHRHEGTEARRHEGKCDDVSAANSLLSLTSCLRASVPSCLPSSLPEYAELHCLS